ncbi:MAG TPA: beta-ketoacyl synthase chain length factor [Burkholderiaceae bacterium]|nr:beta-ketoacyl synthase chain length factor [Burkholderiaceae bacterium]
MSRRLPRLYVEGIAFWTPALPGWERARDAFRGTAGAEDPPARRPSPQLLPAAERRRASDIIALSLEVAAAAVAASGREPATLPSIFVSAHGDLAISDWMCSQLAADPALVSPTKFHNSVHNAPVGYWTIATGCMQASTALTAFERSFAAGMLEAAVQCVADVGPVLLVGCDVPACGPLATINRSRGHLAAALVLAPQLTPRSSCGLDMQLVDATADGATAARHPVSTSLAGNGLADALPLFEALAAVEIGSPGRILLPLVDAMSLELTLEAVP